jgi:hypothetical protein
VTGYESFIGSVTSRPKDRRVLAATVAGRADVLVTENLRDFPAAAVRPCDITVTSQDEFLLAQLELYPGDVLDALRRQASRYRREPGTMSALLGILGGQGQGCPRFASQCPALL